MSDEPNPAFEAENEVRGDYIQFEAFTHRKDLAAAAMLAVAKQIALLRRELAQHSRAPAPADAGEAAPKRKRSSKTQK